MFRISPKYAILLGKSSAPAGFYRSIRLRTEARGNAMKNVTIIYRTDSNRCAIDFIKENLEEVFGQHITFQNCFLKNLHPGDKLKADAFLALDELIFHSLDGYIDDFSKIIKMNRSPDRDSLRLISKIPAGTTVLIVNDSYETSLDTTNSFYETGIGHINMIPYDAALAHTGIYDSIEVAITPAEPHLVPPHIHEVIDIGYRKVSFDTMFKLMKMLDLDIAEINRNLFRHIHSVVESNSAFHSNYVYGYLKSEMLNHIVDTSKIGMVLVDHAYQIVYMNDRARKILQCDDLMNHHLTDYIDQETLNDPDGSRSAISILGENFYCDKYPITLMDEVAGFYITLQDEAIVDTASKMTRQKGFTSKHQFKDIIHSSTEMDRVIRTARQIALTDHTVLIRGESGTGKELFAQSIHNASYRNKYPFVAVNCAAIPDNLLESELFGYEAGAFTGAQSKGKKGLFEEANHGTIFLDEIGDLSPKLQGRLLRTIQERQIMRLGSDRLIDVDIRLLTATNKDLETAVRVGEFRGDLFFRLNVLPLVIPPLRERKGDVDTLLQYFFGSNYKSIPPRDLKILLAYDWPGNIRELQNVATYFSTLTTLPEYIYQFVSGENRFTGSSHINSMVLEIIRKNTEISHGIGRGPILQQLNADGIKISDVKLRSILSILESNGLITVGKGRFGTSITERGLKALDDKESLDALAVLSISDIQPD